MVDDLSFWNETLVVSGPDASLEVLSHPGLLGLVPYIQGLVESNVGENAVTEMQDLRRIKRNKGKSF